MREGWEIKKLGEVATYVNGYAFKPEDWVDKGVPIIRIQNLNNPNTPYNCCNIEIPSKYIVERGDILISWSASLGVYEWRYERGYLNQHIFKVVFDKGNISKYYLKYAVTAKLKDMQKQLHGATMKHIVKKDFDNTLIPVPPLSKQEKIVVELDCLSGIIEKKKQQLKELDSLAQSIFYEMFGDPVENEKGWEVKALGEVCVLKAGKSIKAHELEDKYLEGLYPCYGGNGVRGYISKKSHNEILPIIGRQGALCGNVVLSTKQFYATEHAIVVTNIIYMNVIWLYYTLKFMQLNRLAYGVAQPGLSVNKVNEENIILPPLTLQQQFAEKIEVIEKQKELIKQSIKETETLFNSRMDYYFNS